MSSITKVTLVPDSAFPDMQLVYYFKNWQDAMTSFATTYSKCGRVTHQINAGGSTVYNLDVKVGEITAVSLPDIILDQPTHF